MCAECRRGAAFGSYWLLTERLRYEKTPLLPALRDRVHVHGQRDDAMAAIAEAVQPRATAEQQAQADATNSDIGKAEDGASTNATADTVEDSPAASTGTSAANTETADGTTAATNTLTPSLRAQANPTPEAISATPQTTYAHSATAAQNGVTFTVSWNDAPAGTATTFHVTQTNGSSQAKARMDVPTYWDGGSHESVCDPSRPAWASYYSLRARARDRAQRIHVGPQFTCMELAKVPIPNQKW